MSESHISTLTIKGKEYNIGGDQFAGDWVYVFQPIVTSGGSLVVNEEKVYDISSYLPNDEYDYEIQLSAWAQTKNATGQSVYLRIWSGKKPTSRDYMCSVGCNTRSSYRNKSTRTFSVPINADDKYLHVSNIISTSTTIDVYDWGMTLIGYRRIGKKKKDQNYKIHGNVNTTEYYATNLISTKNIATTCKPDVAEFYIKFTMPNTTYEAQQVIAGCPYYFSLYISANSYYVSSYDYGASTVHSFEGRPNTTYWVKIKINRGEKSFYYSEDGTSYNFVATWTDSAYSNDDLPLSFGDWTAYTGATKPFYGCIDLSETYIVSNGKRIWSAIETPITRRINAIPIGEAKFQNDVGYNFSIDNYFVMPKPFNPGNSPWEMLWKVSTGSDLTTEHNTITGCYGLISYNSPTIQVLKSGYFNLCIPGNGSEWLVDNIRGTYLVQPNTYYYIKVYYTGTHYKLDYSLDGVNFINDISVEESTPIYAATSPFIIGNHKYTATATRSWTGKIFFNGSYIKINDEIWWEGVTKCDNTAELDIERFAVPVDNSQINGIIHGTPKIEGSVVSNFSDTNYVEIDAGSPDNTEYVVKFTIPELSTITNFDTYQVITYINFLSSVNFNHDTGTYKIYGSVSAGWQLLFESNEYNKTYWIKLNQTMGSASFSYSTDGINYSTLINPPNGFIHRESALRFGSVPISYTTTYQNQTYFEGSIDFAGCYIKQNNELIWEGYKPIKNLEIGGNFLYGYPTNIHGLGTWTNLASGLTIAANSTSSFDLSTILPNDECDYEVELYLSGKTSATAGAFTMFSVGVGNTPTNYIDFGSLVNDTAAYEIISCAGKIVVPPYNRVITVKATSNALTNCTVRIQSFRRCSKLQQENILSQINEHKLDGRFADGTWVQKYVSLVSGETLDADAIVTYSLGDYLPAKLGLYEIIFSGSIVSPTQSYGTAIWLRTLKSDWEFLCGCMCRTSGSKFSQASARAYVWVADYDNWQRIYLHNSGGVAGTNVALRAHAYRYIGTNY